MTQVEFKFKSYFNEANQEGFIVIPPTHREIPIPNNGKQASVFLKPNERLYIIVRQDGRIKKLGSDFDIRISPPPNGLNYKLTKKTDKYEIKLESNVFNQSTNVTVGVGTSGSVLL